MNLTQIAHIENGFQDKFGIPRQSREGSLIESRIVFEPAFRVRESLRGIEEYSHLWLIWEFSEAKSWSPTVRPPRLGGNTRMGVFATRSPFRPNRLGLSSVRLLGLEETSDRGVVLVVSGADLLDGTPIYDIKPYLSFSDSHPDARNGFADAHKDYRLRVEWGVPIADDVLGIQPAMEEILSQDPRPAYQNDPARVYKLDYAGVRVEFTIADGVVLVKKAYKPA